jgi:hypothetical protein
MAARKGSDEDARTVFWHRECGVTSRRGCASNGRDPGASVSSLAFKALASPPQMSKVTLIRILRLTVSLALLAFIYQRVDLHELRLLLVSVRWKLLLVALALIYSNIALSTLK